MDTGAGEVFGKVSEIQAAPDLILFDWCESGFVDDDEIDRDDLRKAI